MAERVSWSRGGSVSIPPYPPLPGASLQGISTREYKPQPSIPAEKLLGNAEKLQFLAGELLGCWGGQTFCQQKQNLEDEGGGKDARRGRARRAERISPRVSSQGSHLLAWPRPGLHHPPKIAAM